MFSKLHNYVNRQHKPQSPQQLKPTLPIPLLVKFTFMGTFGMMLGLMFLVIGFLQTGDRFFATLGGIFNSEPAEPEVDITSLIVQQVRGASELTTAIFTMEAVVPAHQDRKLGNLTLGQTKLLYIAQGEVRAGVDLSAIESQDVQVAENSIQLILPPPEILDSKIDVERSQVYDYDRGFLSLGPDVAPQLQVFAEQETLKKIKATACAKGVLEEANERAQLALTNLLNTTGYQTVLVKTSPPQANTCS